jgi:hypothetical protein
MEAQLFGSYCWPSDLPWLVLVCKRWHAALARDVFDLYYMIRACQCYDRLTSRLDNSISATGKLPMRRALLCNLCLSTRHRSENLDFSARLQRYAIEIIALSRRYAKTTCLAEASAIYLVAFKKDEITVNPTGRRAAKHLASIIQEFIESLGYFKRFKLNIESDRCPDEIACGGLIHFSNERENLQSNELERFMRDCSFSTRAAFVYF